MVEEGAGYREAMIPSFDDYVIARLNIQS